MLFIRSIEEASRSFQENHSSAGIIYNVFCFKPFPLTYPKFPPDVPNGGGYCEHWIQCRIPIFMERNPVI
jgi:hypothetical protein